MPLVSSTIRCVTVAALMLSAELPFGATLSDSGRRAALADEQAALRLFDERILPALKQHCFECHSAKAEEVRGNFRADTKEGLRKGGDNGPAIMPGDPERSFLLRTMSYKEDDYKMPPRGKLDDELLADFARWIKAGAPDSRK